VPSLLLGFVVVAKVIVVVVAIVVVKVPAKQVVQVFIPEAAVQAS